MKWTLPLKISTCNGSGNFAFIGNIDELEVEAGANLYLARTVGIGVNCEDIHPTKAEALTINVPVSDICMFQKLTYTTK